MTKHIVDNDGDWWKQYKGQGVGWMPGKKNGKESATDARCSANQGPPTRICACKAKHEIGDRCGSHGDCTSGFCEGAPPTAGENSGVSFLPQIGKCKALAEVGQACSTHEGCKSGYCASGKCASVSWSKTNGAARGIGRLESPWCLSNGPDGCALVMSMNGAGPPRETAIKQAQRLCSMIDECESIWCCTTGCTNAICYGSTARSPNYKNKDCPGLKGSYLESKIPVQMWTIKRSGSDAPSPSKPSEPETPKLVATVPWPFKAIQLDWEGVKNPKSSKCFKACSNRGGFCDWCGPKGACCQAGFVDWTTGAANPGCSDAVARSAGHEGFGCVPASGERPKKMTDAKTGEPLNFQPMEKRFNIPHGNTAWILKKHEKDLSGLNYQVLLRGYQCGPPTSTWAKTYHQHVDDRDGWRSAKWCLTKAKEKGVKAILWTPGWTGREQGMKFVEPSYNCAFEMTKDVECPEGFTKVKHKGNWLYIEVLPDGPRPKIDGSFVMKKTEITKDVVHKALAASALGGVKPQEIEVVDLEEHAGGGLLVQFVGSVDIVRDLLAQLKDPTSSLAKSSIGSFIDFPSSKPTPPGGKPSPGKPGCEWQKTKGKAYVKLAKNSIKFGAAKKQCADGKCQFTCFGKGKKRRCSKGDGAFKKDKKAASYKWQCDSAPEPEPEPAPKPAPSPKPPLTPSTTTPAPPTPSPTPAPSPKPRKHRKRKDKKTRKVRKGKKSKR